MNFYINNREYTTITSLHKELTFENHKNYLFDLTYLGLLQVEGEKSSEFLQGQLSCDLQKVTDQHMRSGAFCNIQGRIMALMDVVKYKGLKLILPKDLLVATQHSLAKAAIFSNVRLEKREDYQLLGIYQPNLNSPILPSLTNECFAVTHDNAYFAYNIGDHLYLLLVVNEMVGSIKQAFQEEIRGSLAWHFLQLTRSRVEIYPESRGLFLPHRLDLHLKDYLSFDKGCYRGQEIIARTHYRAKLKHQLKLFTIQSETRLFAGEKLLGLDNNTVGEIVDSSPVGNGQTLIAVSILINHPDQVKTEKENLSFTLNPYKKEY